MPTYYPGPDVVITDKAFTVLGDRPTRFRIQDLVDPYVIRGARRPAGVVTGRLAIGTAVAGAALWPVLSSTTLHLATVVAVAVPVLATGASMHLAPRTHELRAVHRSIDTCLYRTTNTARFGQVRRALVRAVEEHRQLQRMPPLRVLGS